MKFRLATWNINSVRLRIEQVTRFTKRHAPDVLCLQEIKCTEDVFPHKALKAAGYEHIAISGQKGYHGVAICSRIPFRLGERKDICGRGHARHVSVELDGLGAAKPIELHNLYVPAGGDIPDPAVNDKFRHKLDYLDAMESWFAGLDEARARRMILVGDLNVAPLETDVWSHQQLLKVVSHTPPEVERLNRVLASYDWIDVMRKHVPPEKKLFTWWSYRARDWRASNRGRRLDHVWTTPALKGASHNMQVFETARDWERPSDHAPVIVDFKVD